MKKKNIVIFKSEGPLKNLNLRNQLKDLNFNILSYPILKVKKIYSKNLKVKENSIIFTTSFHSVFFLSELTLERNFKLYTLGEASSLLAKDLGFKNVIETNGDSATMLNRFLIDNKYSLNKNKEDIIYVGAKIISYDLPKMLKQFGYKVKRYKIYETLKTDSFKKKFIELVENKKVAWIVLLSKKGAKNYIRLSNKFFSKKNLKEIKFACLSKSISDVLTDKAYNKFYPEYSNIKFIKNIIIKSENYYAP